VRSHRDTASWDKQTNQRVGRNKRSALRRSKRAIREFDAPRRKAGVSKLYFQGIEEPLGADFVETN